MTLIHPIVDKILALISFLITAGSAGAFYYTLKVYQRPEIKDEKELVKLFYEAKKETFVSTFPFDKMLINLYTPGNKLRFLSLEVHFLPVMGSYLAIIEENKSQIIDGMIRVIGKQNPDEIVTLSGKLLLAERIRKETNRLLKKDIVKNVLFPTFIVQ